MTEANAPTRRTLLIFGLALVGVPAVLIATLTQEMTARTGEALLGIIVAGTGGAIVGATLVRLAPRLPQPAGGQEGPMAVGLIIVLAVAGTASNSLPPVVVATVDGAVIGFFAAFAVVLIAHWKRDPAFRSRIRSAWAGERVRHPHEAQQD